MKRLYKLGSLAQDTRTGLITLFKAVAKDKFDTFQYPLGTNYQVPENMTFSITEIVYYGDTAKTIIRILYGDDVVTGSATPPANEKFISPFHVAPVSEVDHHHETLIEVPEFKYPAVEAQVGAGVVEIHGVVI